MSDILTNASRYNTTNSFRKDGSGSNTGSVRKDQGAKIGFDCSGLVYHVLRESGYNVPYAASSVLSNNGSFTENWATKLPLTGDVPAGTLVYFNGHVGIVRSYDPTTKTGTFLSMTGKDNEGSVKPAEAFTTDTNAKGNIWGANGSFKGFAAVKPELYDPQLDQHANGANPDTPVFNIPEHKSSGFITLPNNGGFPTSASAHDLSNNPAIAPANAGLAPQPSIDAPSGSTAFAQTLAHLESNGQPNDGYGAWKQDGQGIGAVGRYGFRSPSLKAIGWLDANGNWTADAKAQGVDSVESFRDNPAAQEMARIAYMQVLKNELKTNGAWSMIGESVEGHTVTESGLIASAWKEGAGAVLKVFNGNSTNANADKNVFFRLDEFNGTPLNTDSASKNSARPAASTAPSGHWEDTGIPLTDANGNQTGFNEQKWVEDPPSKSAGNTGGSTNTTSSPLSSASQGTAPTRPTTPATPSTPQLSPDGTTATLPNGQVIHAGTGANLSIDLNGNLVVDRPASGWTNADGSPSDIRQVTTFDAKGQQLGTVVAQNLPGQSALIENGEERSIAIANADGTSTTVQAHFSVGTGWIDNQSGQTVLSLKDWQAQTDAHNANLQPGPSADNDYQPDQSNGEAEARANTQSTTISSTGNSSNTNLSSDPVYVALLDQLQKPDSETKLPGTQTADAGFDASGTVNDAGSGAGTSNSPTQGANDTNDATRYAPANNAAAVLNLANSFANLSHFSQLGDVAKLNSLVGLYNQIDHLGSGLATLNNLPLTEAGSMASVGSGNLPGDLSIFGAGLSLISSLQGNDPIAQACGAASLANAISGGNMVPIPAIQALNLLDAMQSGNTVGMLSSSVAFVPGWGPAASIAMSVLGGSLFGSKPPPPPAGHVVYSWDESGHIIHTLDFEQSKGGAAATQIAQSVQTLLENVVSTINSQTSDAAQHVALNPYRMPSINFADGHTWLYMEQGQQEGAQGGGNSIRVDLNSPNLTQELVQALGSNGGLLPQWQVQTLQAHLQALRDSGAAPEQIAAERNAAIAEATTAGHTAQEGTQAFALQGNSVESADFKTQSLGALVVKLGAIVDAMQTHADALQATAHIIATTHILKNTDSDAYLEKTQWVSATDADGNLQGILVLDHNNNGLIEMRERCVPANDRYYFECA